MYLYVHSISLGSAMKVIKIFPNKLMRLFIKIFIEKAERIIYCSLEAGKTEAQLLYSDCKWHCNKTKLNCYFAYATHIQVHIYTHIHARTP